MRHIDVVTLFPNLFQPFLSEGLLGRACRDGQVAVEAVDLRSFGLGRHRQVDDEPYGGGAGMVLRPEPVFAAVRSREAWHKAQGRKLHRVLVTPQGRRFNHAEAVGLAETTTADRALIFVCGRYEGFDERIRAGLVDDELSVGDFVCLGGEVVAMVMIEAVARLWPHFLGNPSSLERESFAAGQLEHPQYTRPMEFEGLRVPKVLLSGHHREIDRWRKDQALQRTRERRPDLIEDNESDNGPH